MNTRTAPGFIDLRVWYLPDWLYAAWPFIHLLGGATILATFSNTIGHSSGLLLVMAGLTILAVRGWHRSAPATADAAGARMARRAGVRARSYYNDPAG